MEPFIFSIQYLSDKSEYDIKAERGIMFAASYSDAVKTLEKKHINDKKIIDMYIAAADKEPIMLTEESYNKLLDGEII